MTTSVCRLRANSNNNNKTANTRETTTATQTANAARRRPTISIKSFTSTQLLLLSIFMSQLHQFAGGGIGLAMAAPAPAPTPASLSVSVSASASPPTAASHVRLRLQKREDTLSFKQRFRLELNSSVLEWSNGCGGNWTGPANESRVVRPQKRCAKHKKLLRTLQNKTGLELRQLKFENIHRHGNEAIDISKHDQWKVQSSQYNFLPRLNSSSKNLLRRVHHDMQFYVASFSYLRHAQLHFDYENWQTQSALSAELLRYRTSARNILCLVEEAINATNRLYAPSLNQSQQQHLSPGVVKTVPRMAMEKRLLQFKTPLVELHNQAVLAAGNKAAAKPQEPHVLDALFLKFQYIEYLKHLTKALAKQRSKRKCKAKTAAKKQTQPRVKSRAKQQQKQKQPKGA
ncbi:uncharacterized protein LOC133847948 [Drosophila sulfurigaster albostrigata]|uniref:uncharacterized protein LOC133847948 n=1 Tax=Drosophila sulfurigaster albostrigata TaxID=89887 RepID=UPI002D21C1BE|nr:uncharacterized protein LOC133847948 [Drosophila sulfurigaster albostrigata]